MVKTSNAVLNKYPNLVSPVIPRISVLKNTNYSEIFISNRKGFPSIIAYTATASKGRQRRTAKLAVRTRMTLSGPLRYFKGAGPLTRPLLDKATSHFRKRPPPMGTAPSAFN
ncbi:hypothetical protein AVEN_32526-1 [Araneus ventricosus]|uniref:Uncharacterized protein n=1 Tax=Araneus ventricosus TaxID=182803 RepID=A0A4Y2G7Q4_ARAVE|nr:hypothetical protein AVEN_32526-1 [Araneus ventricosus]